MARISTNVIYMGVGVGGALTNITSYADLQAGITYDEGRQSEFEDTPPGEFTFELDNATGWATPDNVTANAAAGFSTTVAEGMAVCWQLGNRLLGGKVRGVEPIFPDDEAAWAKIRVTCTDVLSGLARIELKALTRSIGEAGEYYWPFDDAVGSLDAAEFTGRSGYIVSTGATGRTIPFRADSVIPTFGIEGLPWTTSTQAEFNVTAGSTGFYLTGPAGAPQPVIVTSPITDGWGMWITPMNLTSFMVFNGGFSNDQYVLSLQNRAFMLVQADNYASVAMSTGNIVVAGTPYYVSVQQRLDRTYLYVNGSEIGYADNTTLKNSSSAFFQFGDPAYGPTQIRIAELTYNSDDMYTVLAGTETQRLSTLQSIADSFFTTDTALSSRPIGYQDTAGISVLDAINEVMATEQGYIYAVTSGTVDAPFTLPTIRARTRSPQVAYSFDANLELDGAPTFVRDLTNMVSTITVESPALTKVVNSGQYTNAELVARVDGASTSERTLLTESVDVVAWAQDRLNRGANVKLRAASITIDAMTTPTDRSADLLAMIQGDRIRVTNLPSTVLGFSTWDGWLIGRSERHDISGHKFTLYFQPVLPDTGVYDSNSRYMADGALTLTSTINTSVTSISVTSSGPLFTTSSTDLPVPILIDSEVLNVTAVSGSSSPQTLTVTRGFNSTTAASHTAGVTLEVADIGSNPLLPSTTLYPSATLYPAAQSAYSRYAF